MQNNRNLLVTIILVFSGLIFAGIAAFMFYQQYTLEKNGIQAEGVVVDLIESTDSDGTTYAPVVAFKTEGGRNFEFHSNFYSSPPAYEVGQKVTVLYPPDRPDEAQIKGAGNLLMIIFGVVGGIELLIGLFFAGKTMIASLYSVTE
jgi:hypothetical protein